MERKQEKREVIWLAEGAIAKLTEVLAPSVTSPMVSFQFWGYFKDQRRTQISSINAQLWNI